MSSICKGYHALGSIATRQASVGQVNVSSECEATISPESAN